MLSLQSFLGKVFVYLQDPLASAVQSKKMLVVHVVLMSRLPASNGGCWGGCVIMKLCNIKVKLHYYFNHLRFNMLSHQQISLARQAQASEMGGQHETGRMDPKSPPVPVQRALHRGLFRY